MPRRRVIAMPILPDPVYNSPLVAKFINTMMWGGKKAVAEESFYSALVKIKDRTQEGHPKFSRKRLRMFRLALRVKSRRVGGANYQVPIEVGASRRAALAMRWLVIFARSRGEKTMIDKLAESFSMRQPAKVTPSSGEDVHRMAEANKAFAHYRW